DTPAVRDEIALLQGAIHKVDVAVGRIREALRRAGILDETLLVFTADHGLAFPRAKGTLYDPGIETALIARWPAGGVTGGPAPDPPGGGGAAGAGLTPGAERRPAPHGRTLPRPDRGLR